MTTKQPNDTEGEQMSDTINANEALEWLQTQYLLFASRPASNGKRVRLWYRVAERRWEVVVGDAVESNVIYGHADIHQAVAFFNERVHEEPTLILRG